MNARCRRLGSRLVAAVLLVLALAGCAGLPTAGPVQEGRRMDEPAAEPIRVVPQGPVRGQSKEDVVRGFLRAAEDSDEARPTAREYLTAEGSEQWLPSSADVYVYRSAEDPTVTEVSGDTVRVGVLAVARIGPDGRYAELADQPVQVEMPMVRSQGEWRIELPSGFGLWLDDGAFERLFVARSIYYVAATTSTLVPDVRWFPRSSRLATTLARAQLAPPPPHLEGGVRTMFPAGTSLGVNAVPVVASIAQVDLNAVALTSDPGARAGMLAQMVQTLLQLPSVSSVTIRADDVELDLEGIGHVISSAQSLGYGVATPPVTTTLLTREWRGSQFHRLDPRTVPVDIGPGQSADGPPLPGDPRPIQPGWTRLALSFDGRTLAGVSGDRRQVGWWSATDAVELDPFATDLSAPALDVRGNIWVSGRLGAAEPSSVLVVPAGTRQGDAAPRTISAPWLKDRTVTSLAFAPDGVRVLIVSEGGDGVARLDLSSIVLGGDGLPAGLAPGRSQSTYLTLIRDVVWIDDRAFAVLGRHGEQPVGVWTGSVGMGLDRLRPSQAEPVELEPTPQAVTVTSLGGVRGLVLTTDEGAVLTRTGTQWRAVDTASDVLVPGR